MLIEGRAHLVGGTIGDIEVNGQGAFITVALRRADGEVIIHPSRATYLALGDSIILMGHQGDMPNFAQQNVFNVSSTENNSWENSLLVPSWEG